MVEELLLREGFLDSRSLEMMFPPRKPPNGIEKRCAYETQPWIWTKIRRIKRYNKSMVNYAAFGTDESIESAYSVSAPIISISLVQYTISVFLSQFLKLISDYLKRRVRNIERGFLQSHFTVR